MSQQLTIHNTTTLTQWLKTSGESSVKGNRALTAIQALESPQISLLNKHTPEELGASLSILLMEISTLVPCFWTQETVAQQAKAITTEYWWMRFDELIYVFRRGIAGKYLHDGEYVAGKINHTTLCSWLNQYSATERETAEHEYRTKNTPKEEEKPVDPVMYEKTSKMIGDLAETFRKKAIAETVSESKSTMTDIQVDERQWGYFHQLKHTWELDQLYDALKNAKKNNWLKTADAIEGEINFRTN